MMAVRLRDADLRPGVGVGTLPVGARRVVAEKGERSTIARGTSRIAIRRLMV